MIKLEQGASQLITLCRPSCAWRIAGGAGAGALLALSFPPWGQPCLLPLAVALLLAMLEEVRPRRAAVYIGLACGAVYFGGTLFWLARLFGVASVSLIAIETAYIGAFGGIYGLLRARWPGLPSGLTAAIAWTALEYCRAEVFPLRFGWMGLGYALVNAPAPAALASLFGSQGLSFALVAFGGLLHVLMRRGGRGRWLAAGLYGAWIVLLWLPRPIPEPVRPLTVRLVQAGPEETETLQRLSRPAPGHAVDCIVWPEYSLLRDPARDGRLWGQLAQLARESRACLIFGGEDTTGMTDAGSYRNTAYVLGPDGRLLGRHVKNHTVHFFHDGVPGTAARAIPTPKGRLGVAICFDMDYPDVARRLAADGAEVFLVPNMDPAEWGPAQRAQHRLMFQMRAVECGRWLARADVAGGTSVAALTGRETARVPTGQPVALEVRVGCETRQTLYVRGGWRFAPCCLAVLVLLCLPARRPSHPPQRTNPRFRGGRLPTPDA